MHHFTRHNIARQRTSTATLSVAPGDNWTFNLTVPGSNQSKSFLVFNNSTHAFSCTAALTFSGTPWCTISEGLTATLAAGASDTLTLTTNAAVQSFTSGTYTGTLTITNTYNNVGTVAIPLSVTVSASGQG